MRHMTQNTCAGADFCPELSGELDTEFHRTYQEGPRSRIIGRSSNLYLLVDMSPLCVGHLLIVAKQHYLSFADVIKVHGPEVKDVLDSVLSRYHNTFGRHVVLEHGSSPGTDGSACITHAHWHLLPLEATLVHKIMLSDGLTATELGGLEDLATFTDQQNSYFYCADQSRYRVYGVAKRIRRQYLRSVAGKLLGIADPEWDYALVVRKDLFHTTLARVGDWRTEIK
jgi:diadenosine tetraphosphate (Ap4A) HIT family hydrolase